MDLEALDNALKASWQSVAMNMNMVRLLLITRGPSEDTRALLSRSETMMQQLMQVKGLSSDKYRDVTFNVCRSEVVTLYGLMGAGQSVLAMEAIRVGKQVKAAATRAANCDEHNGDKMMEAAQRQADAIRRISLKQGLFTLPPALREIARLRLDNPEMSLKELGELMDPPVGKSGVNHRMRRLMEILDGENPEN